MDRVLLVDAPEARQLERTMVRDQNSEAQVQAIIKAQASRAERQARADDIVVNDGSLEDLRAKVEALRALPCLAARGLPRHERPGGHGDDPRLPDLPALRALAGG